MDSLSLNESIIACLRVSPCSLSELAYSLPRIPPGRIAASVKELLAAGQIVRLEGRTDEGRAIFALRGYVEDADRLDNSDLIFGRDYSGQYEAPIWRDDA
jgi:hypothetical protein